MKTTHGMAAICASLLIFCAPAQAASKFYKWVDESGVTHYSQSPPPEGTSSQEIRASSKASSDQSEALDNLEAKRSAAAKARQEAAQEQATKEKNKPSAEEQEELKKRCAQHRSNLDTLKNLPIVRQKNEETGEMEVVDETKRAKLIEQTEAALAGCP